MATGFSRVLASITDAGDGSVQVVVPPDWLQGRTVFGGMQMAIAARGMRAAMPEAARSLPLRSVQMTFVGPLVGGAPVELKSELLRHGRSITHARCDLRQAGTLACSAVGLFGAARSSSFVQELPAPRPDRRPDEVAWATIPPERAPAFTRHFEMRWALGSPPFSGDTRPHSQVYARLRDRECATEDALLALADVIPTPVLSMLTRPAPASSLNWMLEVLRDPAQLDLHGWCLLDTHVRAGTDGYLSQTSVLYGPDGHAYSVSHQTVGVFA